AEDGIRDRNVTGVQTCALPISAEGDRSGLDSPRVRPVAEEERLLADDRPGADCEQIGAHRHTPGEDHDARPDFRAQRPQIKRIEIGRASCREWLMICKAIEYY